MGNAVHQVFINGMAKAFFFLFRGYFRLSAFRVINGNISFKHALYKLFRLMDTVRDLCF